MQHDGGVDIGRVTDAFDVAERHRDVKVGGAAGRRAMVNTLIVRADFGIIAEGAAVRMAIEHPF